MKRAPLWTSAEREILKTYTLGEAARRLPGRTYAAARSARRRTMPGQQRADFKPWTKAEDRRLMKYAAEPLKKLVKRFKSRTPGAVACRRNRWGKPERAHIAWTTKEVAALRLHYLEGTREEIVAHITRHTWKAIYAKALSLNLRRNKPFFAANELREAVRKRAREDGIALLALGTELGCSSYFVGPHNRTADIRKIALAVDFFGGKLVIDWQDG